MNQKITVFFVDDHPIFRQGLRHVLEADPRLSVVGEAADGPAALAQIKALKPDVALLDIELPQCDGLELAAALRQFRPPVNVIVLTMCKQEAIVNAALDQGVKGYILKDNAATDVTEGIKRVAAGEIFLSPTISAYLLRRGQRTTALHAASPGLGSLSPMERRVLKLLAENKTSKQIGEQMFISHRTVETHLANIRTKLEMHGPHRLLQFAIENRSELQSA